MGYYHRALKILCLSTENRDYSGVAQTMEIRLVCNTIRNGRMDMKKLKELEEKSGRSEESYIRNLCKHKRTPERKCAICSKKNHIDMRCL
jgi:hypothetical protein